MTVLIIGAGLAGLTAATQLTAQGMSVQVLETRDRVGGRILSEAIGDAAFDLGPAWFWPNFQPKMAELVDDLGLQSFQQFDKGSMRFEPHGEPTRTVPPQPTGVSSYRIDGGMMALITHLKARLSPDVIRTGVTAQAIEEHGDRVTVTLKSGETLEGSHALICFPPRLAAECLTFGPSLPEKTLQTWSRTPTWMAGHAKCIAVYERAFWRDVGWSGDAFSYQGPMMEIHDASAMSDAGPFGLFGFLAVPAAKRLEVGDEVVKQACVAQFERIFGPDAANPTAVFYKEWASDGATSTDADLNPPAGHPHYGYREPDRVFWSGKLRLAVTEATFDNGGFLEGAIAAAREAVDGIVNQA